MPIQILQREIARPPISTTWAGKPAANSVPVGTVLSPSDYPGARFFSDGTQWRCQNGSAVLRNWVGANVTFSSATPVIVSVVPGIFLPADMVATPGFSIRNRVQWHREAAAAEANQGGALRLGESINLRRLGNVNFTGLTANQKFLLDETRTINTGLTTYSQPTSTTGQPALTEGYDAQLLTTLSGQTIILTGQGVDSGGSDVWYFDQWLTEVYF